MSVATLEAPAKEKELLISGCAAIAQALRLALAAHQSAECGELVKF